MKNNRKLISSIFSSILTGTIMLSAVSSVSAAEISYDIYNNITNSQESKEAVGDVPFNVFDIIEAHKDYVENLDTPSIYRKSKGIDVSQWQGNIDWYGVKRSGVDFAIIRSGYGSLASQEDPMFRTNMAGAKAAGIQCGTYWYSYAENVEEAQAEAEACYEVIKNYDFTYPVYFDIEDQLQVKLSTAEVSAIIETFCTTLMEKGYYVGLYSYANFLNTKVFASVLEKYDIWVAHFDVDAPDYSGDYGMWQYSSTGSVEGIWGDVDLDYAYLNYPYIISPETYVDPGEEPDIPTPPSNDGPDMKKLADGIDVSFWQGWVDWNAVAQSGVDYAIIRAGYGNLASQEDIRFRENILGAKEAGLGCGVYWYSYASSPEDAVLEAEACYEVIKDYQLEYPVFFDIEDSCFNGKSVEEITEITKAFCSTMESKGYYVGITSYTNFLNQRLNPSIFELYDVWVANYGVSRPDYYGSFGMWQYSSSGTVNGVYGPVDLDYCYYDYPQIMKDFSLNGF